MTTRLTEPTPKGLILDFGGVLTRAQPTDLVEEMARVAGLPIDDFQSRYWHTAATTTAASRDSSTGPVFWTASECQCPRSSN